MGSTWPLGDRRRPPNRNRALFGALLLLDAVVTMFPPLYWAVGAERTASASLLYFVGGSAVVLTSVLVMYALDRTPAQRGERP